MGLIKDRNGMDLTEAGDIKKRWQEYTEELYRKDLHDPDRQPFPSPGNLFDPGIEPRCSTLQADSLPAEPLW